jgi:hypothetical protein
MINRELEYKENLHLFKTFCSYLCIVKNKKLNMANILLLYLQDKKTRELFKTLLSVVTDFESIKMFLEFDPTLYKSKYIMKYLNNVKNSKNILQ